MAAEHGSEKTMKVLLHCLSEDTTHALLATAQVNNTAGAKNIVKWFDAPVYLALLAAAEDGNEAAALSLHEHFDKQDANSLDAFFAAVQANKTMAALNMAKWMKLEVGAATVTVAEH